MKTETELREYEINLSYEVAKLVFFKHSFEPHSINNSICEICNRDCRHDVHIWPHYSNDPAAALEVLKRCYKKTNLSICSCKSPDGYKFWLPNQFSIALNAQTLELAIAEFAVKLWGGRAK